jgi:transposase InsO family protein
MPECELVSERGGCSGRKILAWRDDYDKQRPHSGLGYQTPSQYAASLRE